MASGIESEISQAQKKIAELEVILEQIYLQSPSMRNNAGSNKQISGINEQIIGLRARVENMSRQYVEELMAAGGIDPASSQDGLSYITQLNRKVVDERIAISGAKAKTGALEQRLAEYGRKLESIPAQMMELARLERSRRSTEELYNMLVGKLQEARIAEESEVGGAQIIRSAIIPRKPVRPVKARNLPIGLLLGIFLGAGAAILRQRLDTKIYTPDDLAERGHTMLAALPDLTEAIKKDCKGSAHVSFSGRKISSSLVSLFNPSCPEAESYRRLNLALSAITPQAGLRALMITSAEEGAGKSTITCNLAITMAKAGLRVCILDADLFRPSIHRMLDLAPGPGIDAIAASGGQLPPPDSLYTGIPGLYAITAPGPRLHPGDLFHSEAMRDLMDRLKREFDIILVDTPPVLAATDAAYLAMLCDAILFCAASGSTDGEALEQAMAGISAMASLPFAVLLNRFNPSRLYGYKFTYGYMYKDHTQSIPRI
jgi:tyrosine-protein kinase Etk/Wzc